MITRENYEEFFLLYVDDELPPAERMAVERFVAAHPDLQEELDSLLQCRLQPESDAAFPDKNSLLQYEESLLSYIDGELDETGRHAVEALVSRDPGKERELQQLLMTVSRPDPSIVFPDKESLYHRRRRVVVLPWWQAGVAAAVLGVVVILALPQEHQTTVAITTPPAKNTAPAVTQNDTSAFHSIKTLEETAQRESAASYAATPGKTPVKTPVKTQKTLPAPVVVDDTEKAVVQTTTNSKSTALATIGQDHATNVTQTDKAAVPVTTVAAVNIPKDQSSFATQALLREQESGNNDMADNMPSTPGKTKLRGLFRRVTRAFGKTADRDDDGQRQVLISAFQVALK